MELYQKDFANLLVETESLFFGNGLTLKDGRPTPYFVNIGKFNSGKMNFLLGSFYADMLVKEKLIDKVDIVYGPSYKGSAIANGAVNALWINHEIDKKFEYDRKEAKAHGEASQTEKLLVNDTLKDGSKIFVVDDVWTSGATKYEAIDKIIQEAKRMGYTVEIVGFGIAVDREQTTAVYDPNKDPKLPNKERVILNQRGEDAIADFTKKTGIPVYSVVGITGVVDYLHEAKVPVKIAGKKIAMPDEVKADFDEYIRIYGTKKAAESRG
jgi:orotate phosphoribosyltransferase